MEAAEGAGVVVPGVAGGGEVGGGVAHAIVGTLLMAFVTAVISVPIAIGTVIGGLGQMLLVAACVGFAPKQPPKGRHHAGSVAPALA